MTVRSVVTGRIVATRTFAADTELVDAAGSRIMVGSQLPDRGQYWLPFRHRLMQFTHQILGQVSGDAEHGLAFVFDRTLAHVCGELIRTARPHRPL